MLTSTSLLIATSTLLAASSFATPVQVSVDKTTIVGDYNATADVDAFLGVKYATAKRFERSLLVDYAATQTLNASVHAPSCVQINNGTGYTTYGITEDCTYLEVYRPHGTTATSNLPVMVWIHGGGGTYGAASIYPAYNFVKQSKALDLPVIVVTLNYRLAAWGFIASKEAAANKALNLALYDQQNAFKWVQNNIGAFGGDKTKVSLFGHSSGSMNIQYHHLTQNSDLFRGSVLCNASSDTFACLKTVEFDKLQVAVNKFITTPAVYSTRPWGVVVDGEIIPDLPSVLISQGQFAKKPYIIGDVLDEGTFSPSPTPMETEDAMFAFFGRDYLGKNANFLSNQTTIDKLKELYPVNPAVGSPFNTGNETFGLGAQFKRAAAMYGDIRYQADRRSWLDYGLKYGVKGWTYQLSQYTPGYFSAAYGVFHSIDYRYVFLQIPESQGEYYLLAKLIHSYWVSFAYNLDPNHPGNPTWPSYEKENGNLLEFTAANTSVIADTFRDEQISFINSIPEQFGAPRA